MLDKKEHIQCCHCNCASYAEDWDKYNMKQLVNREQRREYKSIMNEGIYKYPSSRVYRCPKCDQLNRGHNLSIVDTNDTYKISLGRIKINENTIAEQSRSDKRKCGFKRNMMTYNELARMDGVTYK